MKVEERPVEAATKLTLEDFLSLRQPTDVAVSPDGSRIAFAVSAACGEQGRRPESHIWTASADGRYEQVTRGTGTDMAPHFSVGGTLAFASDRDHPGRLSLYLLGPEPGDARPVGEIAGSVEEIAWSADGTRLLALAADLGADRAGIQAATKIEEAGAQPGDPKVLRPFQAWRRLYLVEAETGETKEVSPPGVHVFEFDWDATGRVIAVCSNDPSESSWYTAWLGLLDLEERSADKLYQPTWQIQNPLFAGDGRTVCFVEGFCSDRGVLAAPVMAFDLETREARTLAELDCSFLARRDERSLWFAGYRGMGSVCGTISLDGEVDELWSGEATIGRRFGPRLATDEAGSVIASVYDAPEHAPEVAVLDADSPDGWRAVSRLNAEAPDTSFAVWESRTWTADDGLEIEGLLVRPRESTDGPVPLVVNVHGGPTGVVSWSYGSAASYLLAQDGFAVFFPNPRGSAGYGQEFARANLGDMGGGDLRDILAGIDSLVEEGLVDNDRVGITGGSYGGFMTAWAVTQTDRFAAAVALAAVTDWRSFHLTTNIGRFDELFLDADPFEEGGEYDARSPVVQAKRSKTPTLIVHGEVDLCVPVGQAHEMYQALVEAGCETELVLYPREGHGLLEREHIRDASQRIRSWFARHLLGKELG